MFHVGGKIDMDPRVLGEKKFSEKIIPGIENRNNRHKVYLRNNISLS